MLYKERFLLYVASLNRMFYPSYEKLHPNTFTYDGEYAMVGLGEDDEDVFLAKLKSTDSSDLYIVYEVPMAFTRLPVRTLTTNISSLFCLMKPCSLK